MTFVVNDTRWLNDSISLTHYNKVMIYVILHDELKDLFFTVIFDRTTSLIQYESIVASLIVVCEI